MAPSVFRRPAHRDTPRGLRSLSVMAAIPSVRTHGTILHGASMSGISSRLAASLAVVLVVAGCGSNRQAAQATETFSWVRQPITFSPLSGPWERQGENGNGTLGVYFILRGGGGQCISVGAYRLLAERDRREVLAKLISRRDSLPRREFLEPLSPPPLRTDAPVSHLEAATALRIHAALHDGPAADPS